MKKISILVTLLVLCAATLFAQAPEKFSYQAVVRNASNALVTNAPVGVRVSILQGSASGNAVYVETHTASTNVNGLLTLEIGGGTVQQGSFAGINWANGPFFLKTETDPAGGTNYTVTSTQQLMSVPYALYAEEAGNGFSGDYNDLTNKPTIPQNVGDLINDAGYVTLDSIPAQVNADWNATEGPAMILNKPQNAHFGHGIVRLKVNNAVGDTNIVVGFSNYTLMNGGVVSISFTNDVPAGATLDINEQGAKPIHYRGPALTAGVIKANDRCLFMYNASGNRYYLIANDRWGVDLDALATVAHTGDYNDLVNKPTLFSGDYNDLTNKPTIPTVPTNVSAFVNDAGYLTSIPDSLGGIVNETDPVFTAWDKNYNDLTNKPELFSGNYNDLTNKPVNADFGHGIVRTNVNNPSGATDINVTFTGYQLMNGGVVSLAFTRNVPAGATLNINGQGAKAIRWKGTALTDGIIKAGDRCLFMFNSGNNSYYLLANDRWGVDLDALATVAHTGSYNDLTDKPTIPTVPTNISAFVNDMGYITAIPDSFGGISLESDPVFSAWDKDYNDLTNRPDLAPVATSGDYNDLTNKPVIPAVPTDVSAFNNDAGYITQEQVPAQVPADWNATEGPAQILNKPTIPTVPTNISAFVNDMGYITAIPDSFGGISIESDPIFSAWDKDYNDLTNRPELFSGNYNDLTNKPVNADFGHGIVRTNVNNAAGATDINVTFTGYQLMNGGVVSLGFTRNVPAGATLNINNQGAKAIRWKGVALTDGVIKAGDRCLFMYNSGNNSYYLLANDRWGVDIDALATVAHTGSYNDLTDKPNLAPVATSGNYNDLTNTPTIPTVPTNVSDFNNDAGYITSDDIPAQVNADWNATEGAAQILNKPELAPVATSGNYNDLTDKPTIPTVPTNVSAFVNDMGYLTAIPDSFGGISIESDPVFSNWDRDYNSLTNLPELFSGNYNDLTNKPTLFSGNYNDLTNKPTNADFGHGLVRTNVNNAAGATDINVTFTGYQLMNGGVVSLAFTRNVPAGATLNINGQGAKAIRWKGTALTDGIIKAGDRCLFMFNSGNNSYYLLANDRWGVDIDALATVAHTGSYNDLTDKPNLAPVATSGNYNDLTNTPTIPTVPTNVSNFNNDAGYITTDDIPAQQNADWNATEGAAQILNKPDLAPVATSGNYNDLTGKPELFSGDYNDLTNKPTNATFGQGLVRTKVSNAVGATDISVTFTGYALENGGMVSLAFVNNVPAGATLNINNKGAKPIFYKEAALTAGVIKAGDRCLFMYNSGAGRYYLLANDRWGTDIDALATVAHTGDYNDLINTPEIPDITGLQQQLGDLQNIVDDLNNISSCPSKVKDIEGNVYNTVEIGEQCWMKENLRTTHYADGTAIPAGSDSSSTNPYYYDYSTHSLPLEKRGYLYNWPAVMHGAASSSANPSGVQGICPAGWHLPSDAEWTAMEATQTSMDVTGTGWRGDHAGRLAGEGWNSSSVDGSPGNASDPNHNASGFSIVPAGYRAASSFTSPGYNAVFWSSTEYGIYAYIRNLGANHASVKRNFDYKYYGYSVRCLRDNDSVIDAIQDLQDQNDAVQQQLDSLQSLVDGLSNAVNFECGTSKMVDADGNEYETVLIGSQCWTKTNLRVKPAGATDATSSGASSYTVPYYYVNSAFNAVTYGYRYNWEAAKLVCPAGWHLPSDAEWTVLMDYLGGQSEYTCGGNTRYIAKALASTEGWFTNSGSCAVGNDLSANNASGFGAVAAGYWDLVSYNVGGSAYFWSSTESGTNRSWQRFLYSGSPDVIRTAPEHNKGLSVRCLRDAETSAATINLHDSLAEVAFTGDYNSLENRPTIPTVNDATLTIQQNGTNVGTFTANQSTNQTVNITTPTVNDATLTIQQNGTNVGTFTANQSSNQTVNITTLTTEQVQAMINDAVDAMQQQMDNLQDKYDSLQDKFDSLQDAIMDMHTAPSYKVPSSGSTTVFLDNMVTHLDVYDWGGPDGNYGNSWDGSLTLVANISSKVFRITGRYHTETGYDSIFIYNGSSVVGANTIVRLDGTGSISEPIYSSGNTITIRFRSDVSNYYAGFALCVDIVSKPSCTAAKAVDVQKNYYNTVEIGGKCWMKENLRTTKYADGSSISNGGSNTSETTPYYYNYSSHSLPLATRGYLYNWAAVMHGAASSSANPSGVQGICPSGWHVPSDAEWTAMEATQTSMDVTADGWRGDHGGRLAGEGWNSSSVAGAPGNTNDPNHNASGFSAVPAGYCYGSSFYSAGDYAYFWSSTEYSSTSAYYRGLYYNDALVYRGYDGKYFGLSVRCLRD